MAFKKVQSGRGEALKPEQLKGLTGFYTGVKFIKAKRKGEKPSAIFQLTKQDGEKVEIWGCGYINAALLENGKPAPGMMGHLIRLTYKGKAKATKGKNPAKIVEVEVDTTKKMK